MFYHLESRLFYRFPPLTKGGLWSTLRRFVGKRLGKKRWRAASLENEQIHHVEMNKRFKMLWLPYLVTKKDR